MSTSPGATPPPGGAVHTSPKPNLGDGKAAGHGPGQPLKTGGPTGSPTPTHATHTPTPAPKPPTPAPKPPAPPSLTNSQQSIYDLMQHTLASWGLSSLATDLRGFIVRGDTSPDTLALDLSQTAAYKARFSGNAERVKNGYSELNPAQYIAMEEGYRNVLAAYGIDSHFASKENFDKLIGGDVKAPELQARAQVAHDQYMAAPQTTRDLWEQYYGTKGDMVASILDPSISLATLQDRGMQVGIGGAAAALGMSVSQKRAQQLQQAGVTLSGAQKAYQQISQMLPTDQSIAQRFGTTFDQTQEENDLLLGQGAAGLKRATLYDEEKAQFKGGGGATGDALGVSQAH